MMLHQPQKEPSERSGGLGFDAVDAEPWHGMILAGVLQSLAAAIDAKDRDTCGHSRRVASLASRLGVAAGMSEPDTRTLHAAGLMHDIGKIAVPESILGKPGPLSPAEFEIVKQHPTVGHRIIREIPALAPILPGVLHHHERADGTGYPHGLTGEQIPLQARILALADAYDAMRSPRPYRQAMPHDRVIQHIQDGAGTQFDPSLTALFVKLEFTTEEAAPARHAA